MPQQLNYFCVVYEMKNNTLKFIGVFDQFKEMGRVLKIDHKQIGKYLRGEISILSAKKSKRYFHCVKLLGYDLKSLPAKWEIMALTKSQAMARLHVRKIMNLSMKELNALSPSKIQCIIDIINQ